MSINKENLTYKSNSIQAVWVGIGSLSSFGLTIISAMILSRYLDKDEYGTYRQILYIYNTLLVVFSAGIPNVFAYFLPRHNINEGKDIINKTTIILGLLGCCFTLFLYFASNILANLLNNKEIAVGLKYFSLIPLFLLPTLGIEGIFTSYKKAHYIALYNIITRSIMLLFIITPVIFLKNSYLYAILGWILSSIISLAIAYKFKSIPFSKHKKFKTNVRYLDLLKYSIPLMIASISEILIKTADQFYISRYFGAATFADFSNGFIQLPFVGMITGAVSAVLLPLFSKMVYSNSNTDSLLSIWRGVIVKSAIIIYPMVLYFIFYADNIIEILYTNKYLGSTIYFRIAMIVNLFNIIIFSPILLALGKVKIYPIINSVCAITIWVLGYLTVTLYNSPIMIAILSICISIIKNLFFLIYTSKQLSISWIEFIPINKLLSITGQSLILLILLNLIFTNLADSLNIILSIVLSSILFLFGLVLTGPIVKIDYIKYVKSIINKNN